MIEAALAALLLVQLDGHWVDFEICQIDRSKLPHIARRLDPPETFSVWVTNERRPGILDIAPRPKGVSCVQIIYIQQTIYVIGTRAEVKLKLDTVPTPRGQHP